MTKIERAAKARAERAEWVGRGVADAKAGRPAWPATINGQRADVQRWKAYYDAGYNSVAR